MQEKNESPGYQFLNGIRSVLPDQSRSISNQVIDDAILHDPFFAKMMKVSPTIVGIFNYATMTYDYFSPNVEEITGYPIDILKGYSGAEFALNTFHPEHMGILVKMTEVMKKYYYEYSLQKRVQDTRVTWTVLLRKANGEYIWTLQQTMVLDVSPDGFPLRVLLYITDISGIKTNSAVDYVFAVKDNNDVGYEAIYMSHHEGLNEYQLTERELEILNCVAKGMKNQEIADKLFISKHTVITHRKNIMKKSGKDNIIQLLID
jgi:DNA-binding CsgD family transcriptional regulator